MEGVRYVNNTLLIAKREYLERVRAKSFLVMTVLIPLLMGGLIYGTALMNGSNGTGSRVAVVSDDAVFAGDLKEELNHTKNGSFKAEVVRPENSTRATLDGDLKARKLDGYLVVTPRGTGERPGFEWVTKSKADLLTKGRVAESVQRVLTRESLGKSGMSAGAMDALLKPVELDAPGESKGSGLAAFGSVYAIFLLMYFVILFYGMNVARSIIEEKTSRVFEVMLATIKPSEMMAGKVIGVGAVGLTQVGIWIVAGAAVLSSGMLAAGISFPITGLQVFFFVLFFILGIHVVFLACGSAGGDE